MECFGCEKKLKLGNKIVKYNYEIYCSFECLFETLKENIYFTELGIDDFLNMDENVNKIIEEYCLDKKII